MANQPVAVVTGAASGLGAALACRLIGANYRVIGVDLDAAAITRAIGHPNLIALAADLSEPARIDTLAAVLRDPLDLVVHCAGTSCVGPFLDAPADALRRVMRVNLLAPILLTNALLAAERMSARSSIVFVSSLSHYVGYPGAAMYAATKDGLAVYGRALNVALAARDIHVMTAFPGPMDTPHAQAFAPPRSGRGARLSPDRIAQAIVRGVTQRQARLVVGAGPRCAQWLGTVWPSLMTQIVARTLWPKLRALSPRQGH